MKVPPKLVRRLLLWPLPVVAVLVYVATVPLLLIAAFVLSYRLPGNLRALRGLGLLTVYLFTEAAVMICGFVLWVGSGFGWQMGSPTFQTAHYALLRQALRVMVGSGRRLFSLSVVVETRPFDVPGDKVDPETYTSAAPVVVMSRHAGPADSILLLNEVMSWQGRRPRIVAKDLLQLDPAFDLLLNRLPNRFISPAGRGGTVQAVAELAADMGKEDAFVIFPEGGNFTEGRRVRAIERLRLSGHVEAANRAVRLRNVLPPHPAGSIAAMDAAPEADAVFVAHTGLDTIAGIGDVWLALPQDNTLRLSWHLVEAETIPRDDDGKEEMLFLAWEAIDAWIAAHRTAHHQG